MSQEEALLSDTERHRLEYVRAVEQKLTIANNELAKWRPIAEKWEPKIDSVGDPSGARITLAFGGKRVTVSVPQTALLTHSTTDLTTHVLDTLAKELILDQLRPLVDAEINRQVGSAQIANRAGKW
jgi:hypothetical protein